MPDVGTGRDDARVTHAPYEDSRAPQAAPPAQPPGAPAPREPGARAAGLPAAHEVRDVPGLIRVVASGARVKYVHFWGHRDRPDGTVGPGCLSQWYVSPFALDGVVYRTAEHWMMASKARLFGDAEAERRAIAAAEPGAAKAVGREVRGFDEDIWRARRFDLVVRGNVAKFGQHEALRAFLLATGTRVLVEASPRDRVWGIGLGASHEAAEDPRRWRGLNLLGFALMEARSRLAV